MKRKGFTIIESLIAIFLTVFISIFIFSFFTTVRQGMNLAENHSNASLIARSLLEDARRAGFDNVAASSGVRTVNGLNDSRPFGQIFNYTISVQNVNPEKKAVWATVTWSEESHGKKVVLETIIVKI
jgi:type II secretory pathway pseudopilin PulG